MITHPRRLLALICLATLLVTLAPPVRAQEIARYENTQLGVAFDFPGGWQVEMRGNG